MTAGLLQISDSQASAINAPAVRCIQSSAGRARRKGEQAEGGGVANAEAADPETGHARSQVSAVRRLEAQDGMFELYLHMI